MPTSAEVRSAMGKPELAKLKALGEHCKIERVLGNRVLIATVTPFTDMDRVQKEGTLYIPDTIKKENTPLPSTGFIVQVGDGVSPEDREKLVEGTAVMFSKFAGSDWIVETEAYKILDIQEIMAIITFAEPVVPVTEDKREI